MATVLELAPWGDAITFDYLK